MCSAGLELPTLRLRTEIKCGTLNQASHPGAPTNRLLKCKCLKMTAQPDLYKLGEGNPVISDHSGFIKKVN